MELKDRKAEFLASAARLYDNNQVWEAARLLEDLRSECEYLVESDRIDRDSERALKYALAKQGLELQQIAIPALAKLGDDCLSVAGKEAVREACKPIERIGTGRDGQPLAPIPSRFTVPPGYEESPISAAVGKVKAGAAAVAVALVALIRS